MKMNRKKMLSLVALLLCGVMLLPLLTACGGGDLQIPEKVEETKPVETEEVETVVPVQPVTQEEVKTEEVEKDPMWDYIPPENYINYTDNTNMESTPNAGAGGNRVVSGAEGSISNYLQTQWENANSETLFTAADRRDVAEKEMRSMLTFRWTPAEEIVYSYNAAAYKNATTVSQADFDANKITLEKGKVYQGLPYTLGSGNVAAFAYGVTPENGLYTVPLTQEILSGSSAASARVGVDDVDALFWAWARVAPSPNFTETKNMTAANGVLPVGTYELTAEAKASLEKATDDVVALNGEEVMYAAYAKLQKADGLVADTDAAKHAMLAVSVTVVNGADGKIDPAASYVTVLEQTDANLVSYEALTPEEKAAKKDEALVIGGIDVKYTFTELFEGGYLPVTCEELTKDGKVEDLYAVDGYRVAGSAKAGSDDSYNKNRLFAGTVSSNRRIVYLNQKFINKQTNEVVLDITTFPHDGGVGSDGIFTYNLTLWDDTAQIPRTRGYRNHITAGALKNFFKNDKKTYRCELVGMLSTGEEVIFRSYDFAYN